MFASIRARVLLVALLPVSLVVVAVVAAFVSGRVFELDQAHTQRAQLIARQVALSSEFSLFSGNAMGLQGVLDGMVGEADVAGVAVFDAVGRKVAGAGTALPDTFEQVHGFAENSNVQGTQDDIVLEPVLSTRLALDDLFAEATAGTKFDGSTLGHVVLRVSRTQLEASQRRSILLAVAFGFIALLLGGLLAVRLGHMVMGPIARVSHMIRRIGHGDFSAQLQVDATDPLRDIHHALNQMAQRLGWSREDLERQIQQATAELREKKEEAEQATQAKSRFLAAASHDLRQPTHALGMFIARLGQLPMDSEMSTLVRNLEQSAHAMQDLLDSLLDLSRLESGAMPAVLGPVSLHGLLMSLAPGIQQMAQDKGLRLRIRPTGLCAVSDVLLLQRMVLNLLHNAVRYTHSGGILVACRSDAFGRNVRLEVWDTGIGISPQDQSAIFQEFFQVANPGRVRSHGLGLGLNIVERCASLLGHTVGVQSRPGSGTRFWITMQRAEVSQPRDSLAAYGENLSAVKETPDEFSGFRVLVVEDDAVNLDALTSLLESWRVEVHGVSSAEGALTWVALHGMPDAILTDYQLGNGADGLGLIQAVRRDWRQDLVACVMSGDTSPQLLQGCKDAGLSLLHKPVRPAKLRNLLRKLLLRDD